MTGLHNVIQGLTLPSAGTYLCVGVMYEYITLIWLGKYHLWTLNYKSKYAAWPVKVGRTKSASDKCTALKTDHKTNFTFINLSFKYKYVYVHTNFLPL